MASRIGTILREARNRREIELGQVEAATRIRLRFLRAIEREEWDVLPGGVYTRGFIRTYASFLGLDGQRLAEDYRRDVEGGSGDRPAPADGSSAASAGTGDPSGRRLQLPRAGWIAVPAVVLVAALAIVLLPDGGSGGGGFTQRPPGNAGVEPGGKGEQGSSRQPDRQGVSVQLAASAEVWVCMLDAKDRHLVDGQILEAGTKEGPFRSGSFTLSFGNGEISILIDGKQADIPATSSPIGFSIDASGHLTELSEAQRPTCA
jgi:cytoskeleton protein RodZ